MSRKATGKPLTLFPIRVDEDVKAVLIGFKSRGTINEGLRKVMYALGFFPVDVKYLGTTLDGIQYTPEIEKRITPAKYTLGELSGYRETVRLAAQVKPRERKPLLKPKDRK